jgi:hypothetical protein
MSQRAIVVIYDDDEKIITSYTCEVEKVEKVIQSGFGLDLKVSDFNCLLDDEFSWKFGAATLDLLSLYNPGLKSFIKHSSSFEEAKLSE